VPLEARLKRKPLPPTALPNFSANSSSGKLNCKSRFVSLDLRHKIGF
jgi:hypothetical protein